MGLAALTSQAGRAEREYVLNKGKVLTPLLRLGDYRSLPTELSKFFVLDFASLDRCLQQYRAGKALLD
jgi:hypothetical protein